MDMDSEDRARWYMVISTAVKKRGYSRSQVIGGRVLFAMLTRLAVVDR